MQDFVLLQSRISQTLAGNSIQDVRDVPGGVSGIHLLPERRHFLDIRCGMLIWVPMEID
jgi:hypothetical protein